MTQNDKTQESSFQDDKPSRIKLAYDIAMLIAISIDLIIICIDNILMSGFMGYLGDFFGFAPWLLDYHAFYHRDLRIVGGVFTLFLIFELLVRWGISIQQKQYYRWFFFPFVHWYEVLGCFPQLRALRLLRAFIIGRRLYQLGYQVLPQSWINTGKFYYAMILEELADRVILTATQNLREQLRPTDDHASLTQNMFGKNREQLEKTIDIVLKRQLIPKLQEGFNAENQAKLANDIGKAVYEALNDTPELRRYLKLIPIAGNVIEGQILHIGERIGYNVTRAINQHLLDTQTLDALMGKIAHEVAQIDAESPEIEQLITQVIEDGLTAFEDQVKIQQWKHHDYLKL